MKNRYLFGCLLMFALTALSVFGQLTVVLNNPLESADEPPANVEDFKLITNNILPKIRKHWTTEICTEEFEVKGLITGSFTKPDAKQTLIFYQFCQTGNGFGDNGLVLIEGGKIVESYISEGGWALDMKILPDINQNGLNEIALYYSGGMHQGEGGTGVDIWELPAMKLKGIGWFQAEGFTEETSFAYKVTAKTGKIPLYYREKYNSTGENKWKKAGKIMPYKLGKIACDFQVFR